MDDVFTTPEGVAFAEVTPVVDGRRLTVDVDTLKDCDFNALAIWLRERFGHVTVYIPCRSERGGLTEITLRMDFHDDG